MGLLEDRLAQATGKDSKDDKPGRPGGGSSLGSIVKGKIKSQQQEDVGDDKKK
ncbi:MAG: hypothetical protein ACRDKW_02275 [Actinomycetota bacterium]